MAQLGCSQGWGRQYKLQSAHTPPLEALWCPKAAPEERGAKRRPILLIRAPVAPQSVLRDVTDFSLPPHPPSALHRFEEFAVRLGVLHLVEQELDRRQLIHGMQELAQDPHLGELTLVGNELLLAGPGTVDVDGREHALLGDAAVQVDLAVAGALELLVDHIVHLRAGIDQGSRENREAAAFLDVARGAKEALRPLQRVRVHT